MHACMHAPVSVCERIWTPCTCTQAPRLSAYTQSMCTQASITGLGAQPCLLYACITLVTNPCPACTPACPQVHTMDAQPVEVSLRLKSTGEWAFRFEVRFARQWPIRLHGVSVSRTAKLRCWLGWLTKGELDQFESCSLGLVHGCPATLLWLCSGMVSNTLVPCCDPRLPSQDGSPALW